MSNSKRKKRQLFGHSTENEEKNGHEFPIFGEEELVEHLASPSLPLTDENDHAILMHRDVHFGGDFMVMLNYYKEERLGKNPYFDYERILYLAEVEKKLGKDLSPVLLNDEEMEKVARARKAYQTLKEIYLLEEEKSPFPRLIADLVLAEDEVPEKEIEAVVNSGPSIVGELLSIMQTPEAYDMLFPGYGFAPYFAIICLGKIGDSRAIAPLFETLEKEIIFDESIILEALAEIGESAKQFLLKIMKSRPLTRDNVNAAFALTIFSGDPEVAIASFEELQDATVQTRALLRTYLLCNCEELIATKYRDAFMQMGKDPAVAPEVRSEIMMMVRRWKK